MQQLGPELFAQNSTSVFHVGVKDRKDLSHHLTASQAAGWQEAGLKAEEPGLKPGALKQDIDTASSILNVDSNSHPNILYLDIGGI